MKQVTDENVRQMASHLQDVESMQVQGMATLNDVLKVRVQLSNAKILDSDAENNVRMAVLSFDATLGIPLSTSIVLMSPLTPVTKELAPMESLLTEAMANRPDLRGMEWRKRGAESGVAAARGGWLPQLYLTGNYYYARPNSRIFPAKDEFKDTWDVGVSLQLDLWNNLTTVYQTDAAQAQYSQAEDGIKALRDAITLEITQTYLQANQNRERIVLAQLVVQQSEENLRVAKEKFSVRLTANSELLDAEVAQVQARLQLTQAFVDYELSIARLEKAAGRGVAHDQQ
jgi:outer membrane protein TolC